MNLAHATEHFFDDPATATIPRAVAFTRARAECPDLPEGTPWYGSDTPVQDGAVFTLDGARLPFPASRGDGRWWVFFADLDPGAKWEHPMWWVFVPAAEWADPARNLDRAVARAGTMPPHGDGPVRWVPMKGA